MIDACRAAGAHYVDVTGEAAVLEAAAAREPEARRDGIVLLPGAGFDVVPSVCLATHLENRLPGMERLRLSISGLSRASRGTIQTAIEALGRGTLVRREGRIVELPSPPGGGAGLTRSAQGGQRYLPGGPWLRMRGGLPLAAPGGCCDIS